MSYRTIKSICSFVVSLIALISLAPMAFAHDAHVSAVRELTLVDSRGKIVGLTQGGMFIHNLETFSPSGAMRIIVILDVGGQLVQTAANRNGFYGGERLLYTASDCQGTPWLPSGGFDVEGPGFLPEVAIGPPGQTIYEAVPAADPQTITINSFLDPGSACRNTTAQVQVLPAQALVDLTTVFAPPFSLRLSSGRDVPSRIPAPVEKPEVPDRR